MMLYNGVPIPTIAAQSSGRYRILAKKSAQPTEDTPDFEKALKELETIVERMEQGDATLEESLRQFERGIALARSCQQALRKAEQKVEILIEENGRTDTRSLEVDDED